MDLYCPVCGEAWDFDTLHEEAQERYGISPYEQPDQNGYYYGSPNFTKIPNDDYNREEYQKIYNQVSAEFRTKGCKALKHITGGESCIPVPRAEDETDSVYGLTRSEAAGALYELLGDDMDGAAAMLDDLNF